ncbi:MAG TPA: hypothetical protein VFX57_04225 [Sulfuricurvum sp.]|nr:hypothetical protein [Sulfuricurvum sp.]
MSATEEIITILKTIVPENMYALDFSSRQYLSLLDQLNIPGEQNLFYQKQAELKNGLVEYFGLSFQKIDIEVTPQDFKLTKFFIDNGSTEAFDRMLHKNVTLLMAIADKKEEYLILPHLLSIPEETKDRIMKCFIDHNESMEKGRTLTRQKIQDIFQLNARDIIFFLRGRISVRYFAPPKKIPEGKDKRYAGESVEELDRMYALYFPQGAWKDIEEILEEVINDKLNFSTIDNATFTKTFILVFRGMIEILLSDIVSEADREKIEGFTGYILRKYFDQILLYTAKNLFEYIENRDKNAEAFLKFFTDEVVIDKNGNKIQKYAIIDTKQQRWNYISIFSILMQYKQIKIRLAAQKVAITDAEERLHEVKVDLKAEMKNKKEQMLKIDEIDRKISENEIMFMKSKKTNDSGSAENAGSIKSKRQEELLIHKKNETNTLELIGKRIDNKTIELSRRQKKFDHESKVLQTIIEQITPIQETYDGIAKGLAAVLTKR